MDPLIFESYARPQVWGQRRLETKLGKKLPATGNFGESWEISAHPHHVSRVNEGPLAGSPLDRLWRDHARGIFGRDDAPTRFPLLIKYLDCHEQLSVQVHPNDEIAAKLIPGEAGKTEAWVIIDAERSARIYAGLLPGTTRKQLEEHLKRGSVADCLHSFAPRAGDCLFLPAGTVHAVGGGVLMAEVQQSSDATFRLFDWNRLGTDHKHRELHVAESLQSIDWQAGPTKPVSPTPISNLSSGVAGEKLVDCDYFSLDRYQISTPFHLPYSGRMSIWLIISGEAQLDGENGAYRRNFRTGETVLIPASTGRLNWSPSGQSSATLLGVSVP
jgi:mannose-6-phosphate isomerase